MVRIPIPRITPMNVVRLAAMLATISIAMILATAHREPTIRIPHWIGLLARTFALLGGVVVTMVYLEVMLFGVQLIRMGLRGQRGP
jgi:hypothetical protein